MYAYIETGGKQTRVAAGQRIKVEKVGGEPGSEVTFDKVLAVIKDGGSVYGSPYVQNARVTAEVVATEKQDKVIVFHMLPRKNHRKRRGHRQILTTLRIKEIQGV